MAAGLGGVMVAALLAIAPVERHPQLPAAASARPLAGRVDAALAGLGGAFEANIGQAGAHVDFVARGGRAALILDDSDAVVSLPSATVTGPTTPSTVRMRAVGAVRPAGEGLDRRAGLRHYLVGADRSGWHTGVPAFGRVRYAGVYRGIDLVYHAREDGFEYDFVIGPGADPRKILLTFEGGGRPSLERNGDLVLHTPAGPVRHRRPVLYQEVDGRRQRVDGGYVLGAEGVGFRVGSYDRRHTLVIDPIVHHTAFGGLDTDEATAITLDDEGAILAAGTTESLNLDASPNANFPPRGGGDAFVAKLTPFSTRFNVDWITYLAGAGADTARAIASHGTDAIVVGTTNSVDFPVKPRSGDGTLPGGGTCGNPAAPCTDAFVTHLDASGSTMWFSRYLGGKQADEGNAVAVDDVGRTYVAGSSKSDSLTQHAPRRPYNAGSDAFVVRVSGSDPAPPAYVGGASDDAATGIALQSVPDGAGGTTYLPTIVGTTSSTDFPTAFPWQAAPGGGKDAFVTTLSADLRQVTSSSYLGAAHDDVARAVALDDDGVAYVAGETASDELPHGAVHSNLGPRGGADAFAVRVAPGRSSLTHSVRIGGAAQDAAAAIGLGPDGVVYVTGQTSSADFPVVEPASGQQSYGGNGDGFMVALRLDPGTVDPVYITYLDFGEREKPAAGAAMVSGETGTVYVAGFRTMASNVPGQDNREALVARLGLAPGAPPPELDTTPPDTTIISGPGPGATHRTSATLEFTASETGSTFNCSLDGAPAGPCRSPSNFTGLSIGAHRFAVAATDPAGNIDSSPAEWSWEVTARPAGGTWSEAEPLEVPHVFHSATVLDGPSCRTDETKPAYCGKVLVAGGNGPSELYDPITRAWSATGALTHPRSAHAAVLLDGPACRRQKPALTTALTTTTSLPIPIIPTATTTTTTPPPPVDPCGKVLVAGGKSVASGDAEEPWMEPLELYDPVTGTWATLAAKVKRDSLTATLLDGPDCAGSIPAESPCGKVFLAGGYPDGGFARLFDPATGTVTTAQSMNGGRTGHSAVLLDGPACRTDDPAAWCGRVLLHGGSWEGRADQIYDPVANKWTTTGANAGAGIGDLSNSAALLDGPACRQPDPPAYCGKVLAVIATETPTAAIYDPASNAWTATATPPTARHYGGRAVLVDGPACRHEPTPAGCGKVLVNGGRTAWGDPAPDVPASTATELYDPAGEGTWTAVESLATGRFGQTANVLATGEVLVAGGRSRGIQHPVDATASAEVFDPSLPGDPPGPAPVHPSRGPVGGGTVLLIGGLAVDSVSGVHVDGASVPFTVESPTRLRASAPPHPAGEVEVILTSVHNGATSSVSAGRFTYIEADDVSLPAVERLDPTTGRTAEAGPVRITGAGFLYSAAATTVAFGDRDATDVRIVADTLMVATPPPSPQGDVTVRVTTPRGSSVPGEPSRFTYGPGSWWPASPLTDCGDGAASCLGRSRHAAVALHDGRVLVAGGTTRGCTAGTSSSLDSAQVYDPATRTWAPAGRMMQGRTGHTATILENGQVLVAGGGHPGTGGELSDPNECYGLATSELYDPATGSWAKTAGDMPIGRFAHTATRLADGRVLVTGGVGFESQPRPTTATAAVFDPGSGTWEAVGAMSHGREHHTATLLPDGSVLVTGGLDDTSAERYDPDTKEWTPAADLTVPRFGHTATLIEGPPCRSPSPPAACSKVLVAGGVAATQGSTGAVVYIESAELYDPATDTWEATGPLHQGRGGHTATVLESGQVLVAGAGLPVLSAGPGVNRATGSSEVYDPLTGRWTRTGTLQQPRGLSAATLLTGPPCASASRPTWCGQVLVAGGAMSGSGHFPAPIAQAEIYRPAPVVRSAQPLSGPISGGTLVSVEGSGFRAGVEVRFGGVPATSVDIKSLELLTAVAPSHAKGPVEVAVADDGASSAQLVPRAATRFLYVGDAGMVTDLAATARSATAVALTFTAADDGTTLAPATQYVVKQSASAIDASNFDAAISLCEGGRCTVPAGTRVELIVTDLTPGATYHYAVQAIGANGKPGPISPDVAVTTPILPPAPPTTCAEAAGPAPRRVTYPGGRYSLVGLPHGTIVPAQSTLYGWFDEGAGGSYTVTSASSSVTAGRGYWAWFACPAAVEVGEGTAAVDFPLGAYHASMVGNPSGRAPAVVSGHDFSAGWDPQLNGGAGGYFLSGYQEAATLAVGEGTWIFSYQATHVTVAE